MHGKPYHKMPVSSWITPGGNREQKGKLIKEKTYPMKSAIQKNLGGPLSEIFFSNLTPVQQDHIGFTPKLTGAGPDVWMCPSDYLLGKVVLKPPTNGRIKQSLTHYGILQLGKDIEDKIVRAHEMEMEAALQKKEEEMKKLAEQMVKQAIQTDRKAQAVIIDHMMQSAQESLATTYQTILMSTVNHLMKEAVEQMEAAVQHTQRVLEEELCAAVESHRQHLGNQYELQVNWLHHQLVERYENLLKKQGQKFTREIEKIRHQLEFDVERNFAHMQAEHVTDLVIQACEKSKKHHEEKKDLEHNFGTWFVNNFDSEIVSRDFLILELEDTIRKMNAQAERREQQLKEIFRHFQKFINYALHEKPGQGEFLLSLETELKLLRSQVEPDGEVEFIAKSILDYILKCISDKKANEIKHKTIKKSSEGNFRDKISIERNENRLLKLVGEVNSSSHAHLNQIPSLPNIEEFKKKRLDSLLHLFNRNPSVLKMMSSFHDPQKKDSVGEDSLSKSSKSVKIQLHDLQIKEALGEDESQLESLKSVNTQN